MPDNPYSTPAADVADLPSRDEPHLSRIALGQKLVIYALLSYLGFVGAAAVGVTDVLAFALLALPVIALVLSLSGMVMIATGLRINPVMVVLYLVAMFIPMINLLALLSLNSRATTTLRAAGYKVGLLGASKSG